MNREPIFNIPEKTPLWLIGILIVIHLLVSYGPDTLRALLFGSAILVPFDTPETSAPRQAFSLVGHGFLHGGWTHLLMNAGMMLAFGVITLRGIKAFLFNRKNAGSANLIFVLIFLASVIGGGVAQWLWWGVSGIDNAFAVGASGGVSGLFATAAWAMGGRQKMLQFGLGWLVINLAFIVAQPILGVGIAWAAHLGGYLMGMLLAPRCVKAFSSGFTITR